MAQENNNNSDDYCYDPGNEFMPREELQALQLQRLQKTIRHAHDNIGHYQRKFAEAGVKPGDLARLEDISRFPFTVKDDLRDAYPFKMFAVPREQLVRVHASSGTTGKPTVVAYTKQDIDTWTGLMARCLACAGVRPGDIVHNANGYGLFTGGLGMHYGAERLGCTVIPMSGGNTEKQILLLHDLGAHVLCATPSYALNIAEVADREGLDLENGPLRLCIFGAEPCSDALRKELEKRLGVTASEFYGLSEVMGPGVSSDCREHAGLHCWEDHFLFEIIDADSGEPLPFGEEGELVITTLSKEALPMIRYRTRDITRLTNEPCACGRCHMRMHRISGRDDDMIIIRGVNIFPSQVEEVLLGFSDLAPQYQLLVSREGALDKLRIEVEPSPQFSGDRKQLSKEIRHRIKSLIGVTCEIAVMEIGQVPRSQGKAVRVRDLRDH
ncbi:MAG: phenylacetate--CoA ligase family protein [Gammaproteobacteria bacterium]